MLRYLHGGGTNFLGESPKRSLHPRPESDGVPARRLNGTNELCHAARACLPSGDLPAPVTPPGGITLSKWIIGTGPCCCGPVGANGPVQMETYLVSGIDFPLDNGHIFGHTLDEGWVMGGGGRSLFFNPDQTAAWVVDLSITNMHNLGEHPEIVTGL